MYTDRNFKTKKALKEAVTAHLTAGGSAVTVFQPGPFGGEQSATYTGWVTLEGPHYPAPHTWYAQAFLQNGIVIKVK